MKALEEVRARLAERFPHVHEDVIEAAVRLAHSELDGPVRDFVPVLVEHAARDRLAFASRDELPPPGVGEVVVGASHETRV